VSSNLDKLLQLTDKLSSVPSGEPARIIELKKLNILDTSPEKIYDDITLLLSEALGVPIALISFVDEDRQWFKSRFGLETQQTSRNLAFCGHVVTSEDRKSIMVVEDASKDSRFFDNPLVTESPNIRFYAGCPIVINDKILGTLCAISDKPRALSNPQREILMLLTEQVIKSLEVRKKVIELKGLNKNGK
jgi:GAF domain-containing protein